MFTHPELPSYARILLAVEPTDELKFKTTQHDMPIPIQGTRWGT